MTSKEKYSLFLDSEFWLDLRHEAIMRDGEICMRCKKPGILHVHHLIYRASPYDTRLEDLETLCRNCHLKEHGLSPDRTLVMKTRTCEKINGKWIWRYTTKKEQSEFKAMMIAAGAVPKPVKIELLPGELETRIVRRVAPAMRAANNPPAPKAG